MNYRADWGAVYITAKFTGTSIGVGCGFRVREQVSVHYRWRRSVQLYANTSTAYSLATGLANTTHTITFMRQTDCNLNGVDITNFWGFTAANGTPATLVPPDPNPQEGWSL